MAMKRIKHYDGRSLADSHKSFKPAILLRVNALIEKDSQKTGQRNSFCDKTFPLGAKISDPVSKSAVEVTCMVIPLIQK